MKIHLDNFKGDKSESQKSAINQALHMLNSFGIPANKTPRQLEMMALCFLALLGVSRSSDWKKSKGLDKRSLKTREIIEWINSKFSEGISSGSYDDIRRKHLKHIVMGKVVLQSAPNSARNSPTRAYGINPDFLDIIKSFPKKNWDTLASRFMQGRGNLSKELSGERDIDKIPVLLPSGKELEFSPGEHNDLQKAIIEEFLPRFGFGAKVLYVGDTANKYLFIDKKQLKALKFFEISHGELPDVIAFSESKNWIFLIEAVHSTGPMSSERVLELKNLINNCSADIIFFTAFLNREAFRQWVAQIAWETEVWIADNPDHMIHFDGDKFLGPY